MEIEIREKIHINFEIMFGLIVFASSILVSKCGQRGGEPNI